MRKILLLLCIPFIGLAQTDYELEFNSATQDYVQMLNASSVIANKIAFSMSAWVYPQANQILLNEKTDTVTCMLTFFNAFSKY